MDFDKIVLSRYEFKVLSGALHGKSAFCPVNSALLEYGLLFPNRNQKPGPTVAARISDSGMRYVLFVRRKRLRTLVPLVMSGVAILISLIALLSQLGILRLQ